MMPSCSIKYHNNPIIGMTCGYLINKNLHALTIYMRKYQAIHLAISHRDSCIGVGVLLGNHGLA